jgi:hypothetical protein
MCEEVVAVAAHKGWNASIHTAEDCIFLDPSKEARICYKERVFYSMPSLTNIGRKAKGSPMAN